MRIRTKIICTMGPSVHSLEKILELIDAGMNLARINFSHGDHEAHREVIRNLKKARKIRKVPLAILLDTKGPEIRVGAIAGGAQNIRAKQKILLVKEEIEGDSERWQITPASVLESIPVGASVLFDDGYITSRVIKKTEEGLLIEIQNEGIIRSRKGVNVPGENIALPAMTQQDVQDICFGCKQDVDIIAASFIRSAEHVLEIKNLLIKQGKPDILVIAKIENSLGVQNFDSILHVADGIMVARGDLGVELPLKKVPSLQKMMIRKCNLAGKPAVTATQMLESMIKNPRPTRAEVSDVANAIYDSSSAVMLSGETSVGLYPVETVAMMRSIIEEAEEHFPYADFVTHVISSDTYDISSSVSLAAVKTAHSANAQAIFVFTSSGFTARLISRCRPKIPIIALTSHSKTYHQLSFNWGVVPVNPALAKNVQEAFSICSAFAMKKKLLRHGDLVVLTAGSPFGIKGTTNMMIVQSIGHVLLRAQPGIGGRAQGKVSLALFANGRQKPSKLPKDRIFLLSYCDESFLPYLKQARGIILQNYTEDSASERCASRIARQLNIPLLTHAEGAQPHLKEGELITLDAENGIVYRGAYALKSAI